ncbi:MAG: SurA N-terminal domain-containing protein [bacterium]|nr:SurA N-terminal domain-containing protein [bacterium]
MMRTTAAVLATLLLPVAGGAQNTPPGQKAPATPTGQGNGATNAERPKGPSRPVLVDRVVATVNDGAIMFSTVLAGASSKIRTAQEMLGRRLQREEFRVFLLRELEGLVNDHSLAQSAKSLGFATPEQIEQLFADELRREEAANVRDFGTWQKFSQELERTNRTWQTYMREQRTEKLALFAKEFAVNMRMKKQENLFLTPRMLRETYERETTGDKAGNNKFIHGAGAAVALIAFRGPKARDLAAAASIVWATSEMSAEALIEQTSGAKGFASALRPLTVTDESRDSLASAELADFALAGPRGAVSPVIDNGGAILLGKIITYRAPRNGRFEDPEVQLELRQMCMESVRGEFLQQALKRASTRTEVWRTPEFR